MPRISVIGCSGSGKSTLSRSVHERFGIPWLELDSLHHQADWRSLGDAEFRARVADFIEGHDDWIIDGNYEVVFDLVRSRCTDLVLLDVPRSRVMRQLLWRSIRRIVLRTPLWNGNREGLRTLLSLDPQESVLLWALKTYRRDPERFERLRSDPMFRSVRFHRLTGPETADRWLLEIGCAPE